MIKYVIRAKKTPLNKTVKFCPQMALTTSVTLAQVIKKLRDRVEYLCQGYP